MAYSIVNDFVGFQPIAFWNAPDTTQRHQLGMVVAGQDPFWGGGEFMYVKFGGTVAQGNVVVWDSAFSATTCPNTANMGRPVGVAVYAATANQFGWVQLSGQMVTSVTASVAAGTGVGITGAGTLGAITAGKQILNAVSGAPSTQTVVKANTVTQSGSTIIKPSNHDGWFVGAALSGTGIPGGTTVASLDPDGRTVVMSAAATASGSVSVTGTYTGFIVMTADRPFAQGQIL